MTAGSTSSLRHCSPLATSHFLVSHEMKKYVAPHETASDYRLKPALLGAAVVVLMGCSDTGDERVLITPNQRLGEVVAELRGAFEKVIEKPVPSLNVLIQTPEGTYFSSSTASGIAPVTPTTYFRFASNQNLYRHGDHEDASGWLAGLPGSYG